MHNRDPYTFAYDANSNSCWHLYSALDADTLASIRYSEERGADMVSRMSCSTEISGPMLRPSPNIPEEPLRPAS